MCVLVNGAGSHLSGGSAVSSREFGICGFAVALGSLSVNVQDCVQFAGGLAWDVH